MDIDSDFCIHKGNLVFKYLNEKYGVDHCCNILTFGRLQTKMVIKDISKVLDIPYEEVNAFTKLLPSGPAANTFHVPDILDNPEYNQLPFVKEHPDVFEYAKLLEGSPRHVSQHPAGIAIAPRPVYEICPVYFGKPIPLDDGTNFEGNRGQFEKEQTELVGLNMTGSNKKVWKLLELPKVA